MSTPNDIDILIHYHCCAEPHPRLHAPAVARTIATFMQDGILHRDDQGLLRTTQKGAAWLKAICSVPYPTEALVDAHGHVIHLP